MSNIGPGVGTLIGLAWGERLNDRDYQVAVDRLQRELRDAEAARLEAEATKDAAKAVLNAMLDELAAEQAGKLKARRFSDPANTAGRNEAFMDTAEGQLKRLSGGSVKYTQMSATIVRKAKAELDQVLRKMAPKRAWSKPA